MMRNTIPVIFVLLLSGLFLTSCTSESCLDETEAYLKISFYKSATSKLAAPDSLTIYGLNMVSAKLYNKSTGVQPATLPLNAATDKCIFIIIINGITDTLELTYSSYPHLISKECGYTFYHDLIPESLKCTTMGLDFKNMGIDSIKISKNNITTINEENIRIFY